MKIAKCESCACATCEYQRNCLNCVQCNGINKHKCQCNRKSPRKRKRQR